ncbi:hypothetical protein E4U14_000325 [Claviceps sp. LM454 group G7]|nr:hypothetical protein E4U14_000325 [Claviceps sp. LM454 group G7]
MPTELKHKTVSQKIPVQLCYSTIADETGWYDVAAEPDDSVPKDAELDGPELHIDIVEGPGCTLAADADDSGADETDAADTEEVSEDTGPGELDATRLEEFTLDDGGTGDSELDETVLGISEPDEVAPDALVPDKAVVIEIGPDELGPETAGLETARDAAGPDELELNEAGCETENEDVADAADADELDPEGTGPDEAGVEEISEELTVARSVLSMDSDMSFVRISTEEAVRDLSEIGVCELPAPLALSLD